MNADILHWPIVLIVCLVVCDASADEPTVRAANPQPIRSWSQSDGYTPDKDLEGSGLAFDSDGSLYMLSEGHGVLLKFSPDGPAAPNGTVAPEVIPLQLPDSQRNSGKGGFDLEAISIVGDEVYVCDEHTLRIYVCDKSDGTLRETFRIKGPIDQSPTGRKKADGSWADGSQKSIEGMTVVKDPQSGTRHFHLLDEHDETTVDGKTVYTTHVYTGLVPKTRLRSDIDSTATVRTLNVKRSLSVPLGNNEYERLTDLVLFKGQFYAIRSVRKPAHYALVKLLPPKSGGAYGRMQEVVTWGLAAAEYSSNFEGAAISEDGRLFVCTDGPGFRRGSWRMPVKVDYKTLLAEYATLKDD